jgi:hypothetical protein
MSGKNGILLICLIGILACAVIMLVLRGHYPGKDYHLIPQAVGVIFICFGAGTQFVAARRGRRSD